MDKTIKTKWFSLKRAYIFVMSISIMIAIMLSTLVSALLTKMNYRSSSKEVAYTNATFDEAALFNATSYTIFTNENGQTFTISKGNSIKKDYFRAFMRDIASLFIVCIIFLLCIIIATYLFYHWKLKTPYKLIKNGIEKISDKELNFKIDYNINDEMGLLCNAFENMRNELFTNFKEQWKAQEDRRILNAAFAHDLRTPLTVLNGQTDILLKKVEDNRADKQKIISTLILLKKHINKMNEYTSKMSSMQRLEDLPIEKHKVGLVEFFSLAEKNLQQLAQSFNKHLDMHADIKSYALDFDDTALMNVIENVANNAFRFAKATVWIDIKAESSIVITVTDDGPGFSEKALAHAYEPFFREKLKFDQDNFGLGLYICSLLLKKHNGTLSISNLKTGGACVEIKII